MGMFDAIVLDRAYECPACGKEIESVQTKEFERTLEDYRVGDCISHAEDIRIVKETLYCEACGALPAGHVYFVVNRGILAGIAGTLKEARDLLNGVNLEKMILWYHDLYGRYVTMRQEGRDYRNFIYELESRFGKEGGEEPIKVTSPMAGFWYGPYMRGAGDVMEAIAQFKARKEMEAELDRLWKSGVDPLPISYEGDVTEGQVCWTVAVSQTEINRRCRLDATWTVISQEQLRAEGRKREELPDRVLVVDEPFSKAALCRAIERQVDWPRHAFGVRVVDGCRSADFAPEK